MDSSRDSELDRRLARIEAAIAGLERSVDALMAKQSPANPPQRSRAEPYNPPRVPLMRESVPPDARPTPASWFASRSAEWWLSRVGIGFVVLAVLLLYRYAVDHGWITPPVRVLMGAITGAVLLAAGIRMPSRPATGDRSDLGFRELLFGAALAVWFVTAYAAAVWYQLIPMPVARLIFFLLGVASAWIALQERREIFAVAAVAVGFATPFVLPAPVTSMTELSLYLGTVTAIGLTIYLMRGWPTVVWITFVAFWASVAAQAYLHTPGATVVLDSFAAQPQWTTNTAPGVDASIRTDSSRGHASAMRMDFDFHGRRGFAIARRAFDMELPRNYQFSFAIRGDTPPNTLEFKLVDSTGTSVWWRVYPYILFPADWETFAPMKGDIYFAFGPNRERELRKISAIEFAVTAGQGGKGTLWLDDLALSPLIPRGTGSIALSILLVLAAAAFTRAPVLRRKLLALGSPRYTEAPVASSTRGLMQNLDSMSASAGGGKSAADSLIVWILMLTSAVLAIEFLGQIWGQLRNEAGGAALLVLGVGALALYRRGAQPDAEIAHVTLTAGVLWVLIGLGLLLPTPEAMPACALVAALVMHLLARRYAVPRLLAKVAITVALVFIAQHQAWYTDTALIRWRWVLSAIVTLGASAYIARRLVADKAEEKQGMILAGAAYLVGLIVIAGALGPIWPPLITATYAALGAVSLILSRRQGDGRLLRYLGGATMVIVVGRLLLIDLATVETIWRVLLFLFSGAVFLYTAYRMQPRRGAP